MIILIDNYDSFSYNLYQLVGEINSDIKVVRNDEMTPNEIKALSPSHIIISPGPKRPEDAGYTVDIIKNMKGICPILGVCLGHQSICYAFGGEIIYAKKLMHGKESIINIDTTDTLFKGLEPQITVARYHSLAAKKSTLPACLKITAITDDDEIMAVSHKKYKIFGVQFHPESVMTPQGKTIIENFLEVE